MHGYGILNLKGSSLYEGNFVDGKSTNTLDGTTYEGDFIKGEYHGRGKLTNTSTNGTTYEGDFVRGKYIPEKSKKL